MTSSVTFHGCDPSCKKIVYPEVIEMAVGFAGRLAAFMRVVRRKKGPMEAMRLMKTRRALMLGVSGMEMAQMASGRVPSTIKVLAGLKTSALIGCPF
jgi:hypothetical protein